MDSSSRTSSKFMERYKRNLNLNSTDIDQKLQIGNIATSDEKMRSFRSKHPEETPLFPFRKKLPAYQMKDDIIQLIKSNNIVVISGETGSGKTTQIPQFILDSFFENCPKIICTQPRRISAITVAERVALERGENLGNSVGYQIRLESTLPTSKSFILYCTTGIVLQWMRNNPSLNGITHLILDEIHERDILCDFLMTLLKDVIYQRPDLKVILMSATLNADAFSKYFDKCPTFHIPGVIFPVKEYYLEDVIEMTNFDDFGPEPVVKKWHKHTKWGREKAVQNDDHDGMIRPFVRDLRSKNLYSEKTLEILCHPKCEELNHNLIAALVHHIHVHEKLGAILVFLPGWDDISKVNGLLSKLHNVQVFPLHSLMPTANQKAIFQKPPFPQRKIILATQIAETSITIDDVVYVINCGKIKITKFNTELNITTFRPEWVSLANSRQRRGRAGRTSEGKCYHLYTKAREMILDSYLLPEIQRKRLEELILQVKLLGLGKVKPFLSKVMDPPDEQAIELSLDLLKQLNAIQEEDEQLTPLGLHLADFPMDPQTGKMILFGAIFGCLDPILSVAASLSFKDAFVIPIGKEELVDQTKFHLARDSRSDHIMMANVIKEWEYCKQNGSSRQFCWDNFLSENVLNMLANHKNQFAQYLYDKKFIASCDPKDADSNINSSNEAIIRAIICAGLYPNVAKLIQRKKTANRRRLFTHQERAEFHLKSVNSKVNTFQYPWMVYHLKMKSSSVMLHDSSMVSPLSLVFFGQKLIQASEIIEGKEITYVEVDSLVKFNCDIQTQNLVKKLKVALNHILENKIAHPGVTKWSSDTEGTLLKCIIELISLEVRLTDSEEYYKRY